MAKIILFEDDRFRDFGPLIYWRTVFELLCGRRTQMDRAATALRQHVWGLWTREWIAAHAAEQCQVPVNGPADADTVLVNGRWLLERPMNFQPGPFVGMAGGSIAYISCDEGLARRLSPAVLLDAARAAEALQGVPQDGVDTALVQYPWDLITRNGAVLEDDWMYGAHGIEGTVSSSAVIIDMARVHIGHGATIKPTACLDASTGPVHISYDATVEAHVTIQGPAYIGPGTLVKPHTHIYGGTSVGPCCKVGGEIDSSIICGHSNKQHGGFLGHSYLGSWINVGAGTTNSDLENTYAPVRMRIAGAEVETGRQFLGAVIGDHTKIGVNQTLPPGASIGFAANVFSSNIVPTYVPPLARLTDAGLSPGDVRQVIHTARIVMARRNVDLSAEGEKLFLRAPELAQTLEG